MPVSIKVTGLDKASSFLKLLGDGAKEVGRTRFRITSDLGYAHWIEEGYYARGRPGRRRAGPAHMLRKGLERMERLAPEVVARNLEKGPTVVKNALAGVAGEGTKAAKAATPVVSGALRASIYSTTTGTGLR